MVPQVQKEKLHAELKQVLSLKRSHLSDPCSLAQPEMDTSVETQMVVRHTCIPQSGASSGAQGPELRTWTTINPDSLFG